MFYWIFFTDLGLNQIINEATHIRGNCLDLIFTSLESIPFHLPKEPFSDHFPIIFHVLLINNYRSIPINNYRSTYSKSSFSIQAFNQQLFSLYELLTFQIKASDFFSLWYYELKKAFSVSIAKKRRKSVSAPFFYSSQTMHLLNKSETIKRRLEKDWTLSDSLKMRESQKVLSESIELDTSLLIEKGNLTSRNDCLKLLRTLKETSPFPTVMNYDVVSFSTDDKKANAFNDFFSLSIVVKFTKMFQQL